MELICIVTLFVLWLRLLARIGFQSRSAVLPSLALAILSWAVIVQLVGVVRTSPPLTFAVLLAFVAVGLVWPGRVLAQFLRPQWRHR
jgi:hypothetical protein